MIWDRSMRRNRGGRLALPHGEGVRARITATNVVAWVASPAPLAETNPKQSRFANHTTGCS